VKSVDNIVICSAGRHALNTNIAGWDYVVLGVDKCTKLALFCKCSIPFIRYLEVVVTNEERVKEGRDGVLKCSV
jgi:hypothetical protein